MLLVDRIDRELRQLALDPTVFEQFATTILMGFFPGLTPISGGTDFGRDADIPSARRDRDPAPGDDRARRGAELARRPK